MGSNPTRAALFSFLRKKELFGLVVWPCFIFIGLRVCMCEPPENRLMYAEIYFYIYFFDKKTVLSYNVHHSNSIPTGDKCSNGIL